MDGVGFDPFAHQLRKDRIHADAIHGDKTQAEREAALADFKGGKTAVLVATDVASRGLDIEGLPQVINFDVPHSPEDYVHRIGRTGRAGMTGEAISLVSPEDQESVAAIEKLIKKRIERQFVPNFGPSARTVAGMMGDEPRRKPQPETRREPRHEHRQEPRREPRREPERKPSDPIFSKPYEPGTGSQQAKSEAPEQPRRKQKQVAALLGGFKKS